MELAEAQKLFDAESVYLNTASYGLPPRTAFEELIAVLADWRGGRTSWEPWAEATESARAVFARLIGAAHSDVAIGTTVSHLVGLAAGSLPDGAHVVAPAEEFTSNLWPFLVQEDRGVTVTTAPAGSLASAIDSSTMAVAFSSVQSSTGEVADLDSILASAHEHGAVTIVDATQGCGWLPLDATRFDFVVVHAYKWLMSPRGSAFMYVNPTRRDSLRATAAGWYAGEDVHESYYGPPLRLADSARRFDVSPVWFAWVGTRPALELVEAVGVSAINEHNVGLANRFRKEIGIATGDSAIVSVDLDVDPERLEKARILAAWRAGNLRVSFHLYNDDSDVDALLDALD